MTTLAEQKCVPCQGGIPPYTRAEAEESLTQLKGWELNTNAVTISKEYRFPDFVSALAFVNAIGKLAEDEGHHPELTLGWGKVAVRLWTHKIRGLHANDFILAAKIDLLPIAQQ